jgi:hypothetical protein
MQGVDNSILNVALPHIQACANNVPERDTRDALTRARAGKTTAIA